MKVIRTPDEHYFDGGFVKFSTLKISGELAYQIRKWNNDKTSLVIMDTALVRDEAHLKELECMEKEIEN